MVPYKQKKKPKTKQEEGIFRAEHHIFSFKVHQDATSVRT